MKLLSLKRMIMWLHYTTKIQLLTASRTLKPIQSNQTIQKDTMLNNEDDLNDETSQTEFYNGINLEKLNSCVGDTTYDLYVLQLITLWEVFQATLISFWFLGSIIRRKYFRNWSRKRRRSCWSSRDTIVMRWLPEMNWYCMLYYLNLKMTK